MQIRNHKGAFLLRRRNYINEKRGDTLNCMSPR